MPQAPVAAAGAPSTAFQGATLPQQSQKTAPSTSTCGMRITPDNSNKKAPTPTPEGRFYHS